MLEQPTLVERLAFGRPVDPSEDATTHVAPRPTWSLVGRLLIAPMFLTAAIPKLTDTATTAAAMDSKGIPAAFALAIIAGLLELVGGLAIAFGVVARVAALGLVVYLLPVTLLFHPFWAVDGMEAQIQIGNFFRNLAMMGGLALLVASGPGRYSVDARFRRPVEA